MSELSELEKRQIEYKEYCKDTRKNKAHPIDFKMWLVFKFKALEKELAEYKEANEIYDKHTIRLDLYEEQKAQLQKLKELFIYTYDALAFPLAEFELGKECNEMYELLKQSK